MLEEILVNSKVSNVTSLKMMYEKSHFSLAPSTSKQTAPALRYAGHLDLFFKVSSCGWEVWLKESEVPEKMELTWSGGGLGKEEEGN